jgi:hypothetical protein|tara:strand:+ start:314 stop:835 length:522 start_codon:yes stop_codon:yes gene_type:complete
MNFDDYESDDEEIYHGKYILGICEHYWSYKHNWGNDDRNNNDKFLFHEKISKKLFYNHQGLCKILFKNYSRDHNIKITTYSNYLYYNNLPLKTHDTINNFNIISTHKNYFKFEIIQKYNEGDITFAIKKTFWLRIFQRKMKNRYKKKIKYMMNPVNLHYRQIHGKWHKDFYHI